MLGLVLSDIHGRTEMVQNIARYIHNEVDFVLILGDLTNFGDSPVSKVIEAVPSKKCFTIPGNLDNWETLKEMEEIGISIHGKRTKLGKFALAGFGGGLQGNPGRVLYTEQQISVELGKLLSGTKNALLATHLPPKNTTIDLAQNGTHVGSAAVRKAIERFQPALHLCGHVHEAKGETRIGKTECINVGPAKEGNALLLRIDEKVSFERIGVRASETE